MTKQQGKPAVIHGMHAKRRGKTKCGLNAWRLPDGNNKIVNTNAIGQVTCEKCKKANKPGEC